MNSNSDEKSSDISNSQKISRNVGSDIYDVEKQTSPSVAVFENPMSHNIEEEDIVEDHKAILEKRNLIK